MRSPVMAILWVQCRFVRPPIKLLFIIFLVLASMSQNPNLASAQWNVYFSSLLIFCTLFQADLSNALGLQRGGVSYHWTLPIKRRHYVALYLGCRVLILALLAFLFALVLQVPDQVSYLDNVITKSLLMLSLQAFFFAVAWAGSKRLIKPFVLVAAGFGWVYLCVHFSVTKAFIFSSTEIAITAFGFMAFCLTAATMSALTFDTPRFSLTQYFQRSKAGRIYWPGRFASSYEAKCWSDWR